MNANRDRVDRAFGSRLIVIEREIGSGDLSASGSGTPEAVLVGTMPVGGVLIGRTIKVTENFEGGSLTDVDLTLGTVGDPDAIIASGIDALDCTENRSLLGTTGVVGFGNDYDGLEIFLTFDPAADSLSNLEAGVLVVSLYVATPDANQGF